MIYYNEAGYLDLLQNIIENGIETPDRTGIGCLKLFNAQLRFDLENGGRFPLFTARSTPLRIAFYEFWMFLNGETDTKKFLESRGINIWKGNTSRDFLDKRGLTLLPEGDLGKSYSYQYRNFGGTGTDQIRDVYEGIKNDPFGRRHLVTIWNPADSDEMPLLPCFHSHQFYVTKSRHGELTLNLKVFSRSWDLTFGGPFNISQFALYLHCMSKALGMFSGEMVIDGTDVHVYLNQVEFVKELVTRDINSPPTLSIAKRLDSLEDLLSLEYQDIVVHNHKLNRTPFRTPKPPMAI